MTTPKYNVGDIVRVPSLDVTDAETGEIVTQRQYQISEVTHNDGMSAAYYDVVELGGPWAGRVSEECIIPDVVMKPVETAEILTEQLLEVTRQRDALHDELEKRNAKESSLRSEISKMHDERVALAEALMSALGPLLQAQLDSWAETDTFADAVRYSMRDEIDDKMDGAFDTREFRDAVEEVVGNLDFQITVR